VTTLSGLRTVVYRLLSDTDQVQFDADFVDDGIRAALFAILPWLFKRKQVSFAADGETTEFTLPTDLYMIISVFDADSGIYLKKNTLSAGMSPGSDLETNQDWLEYQEGSITFANAPEEDPIAYYGAYWDIPTADADVLEPPIWSHTALAYYAASYALLQKASAASNIRQWNVEVDSGTPAMNPMRDMSSYYLDRFRIEMDRIPSRPRGVHG